MATLMGPTSLSRGRAVTALAVAILIATLVAGVSVTMPEHARAATLTVNSADDISDGACTVAHCSLREAIEAANATSGADAISFEIGSGPRTIQPTSALPEITAPVTIDATTQPGYAGTPLIELVGSAAGAYVDAFYITADGTAVKGFVINRFGGAGVHAYEADGVVVSGNRIGTDPAGVVDLGNGGSGVLIEASDDTVIGGTGSGAGNLISGNDGYGVRITGISGVMADRTLVAGNRIGIAASGLAALGNGLSGIEIQAGGPVTIGGPGAGAGNVIAFNTGDGIRIDSDSQKQVRISSNAIFSNGGLGIELMASFGATGPTPNDVGDADTGANDSQNFPVLTSVASAGGTTTIQGTLDSTAGTTFLVELFVSSQCDPSDHGEGARFVASATVTTSALGVASFSVPITPSLTAGEFLTATATDPIGQTSEFSRCAQVDPVTVSADLAVTLTESHDPARVGEALTYAATITNIGPGIATGVTLTDALPASLSFASATSTDGSCAETSGTVTCTTFALAPAESVALSIVATPTASGTVANTVTVTAATSDPDPTDDAASVSTVVEPDAPWTLVVNTSDDAYDGACTNSHCSLREAITIASAGSTHDTITFAIGSGVATIAPSSALPPATQPVTIDGTTQPGFAGAPIIELSGANLVGEFVGLDLRGGQSTVRGLVINRFKTGIFLGVSGGNHVEGNYLGPDVSGTDDVTAEFWYGRTFTNPPGAGIRVQSANNSIGGTTAAARNLISGNTWSGIDVSGSGNVVSGNYVGTTAAGTTALANGHYQDYYGTKRFFVGVAIRVTSTGNTIGGTTGTTPGGPCTGACNVIAAGSTYGGVGIIVAGDGNLIRGNYVGTDVTGSVALGFETGIDITATDGNVIGGTEPGAGNLISGNTPGIAAGIEITATYGDVSNTTIQGNLIGTDATGSSALPNKVGISVYGDPGGSVAGLVIGGTSPGAGNLISGNESAGVSLGGAAGVLVQGNLIGTDISGTADLGNGGSGIRLTIPEAGVNVFATDNTIGGTTSGARNVVSGNTAPGISLAGADDNLIQGNYIGTDITGTVGIPNSSGIALQGVPGLFGGPSVAFPDDNTIGGTASGAGNLISGNEKYGVYVSEGTGNVVEGNLIGTDGSGLADLGNGLYGVMLSDSDDNAVGGTAVGARNVISGNDSVGVVVQLPDSEGNLVQGNLIGVGTDGSTPLGNGGSGVGIDGGSSTLVGGTAAGAPNTIAHNGGDGITVYSGTGNRLLSNRVASNAGLGIDLGNDGVTPNDVGDGDSGANLLLNHPVLTYTASTAAGSRVDGSLETLPGAVLTVQLFADSACDASLHGEGATYLGQLGAIADATGMAAFSWTSPSTIPGTVVTATATDAAGNTSEFSACRPVNNAPAAPTDLAQRRSDGTTPIPTGGRTTDTTVILTGTVIDPIETDQVRLEVEVKPLATGFDGTGTHTSGLGPSGATAQVSASGLPLGPYHWRARTIDAPGAASGWVSYGANDETAADFEVHAVTSLLYNGSQLVALGTDMASGGILSSGAPACRGPGRMITFRILDDDPTTEAPDDGPYTLATAATTAAGQATVTIGTAGWVAGVYTIEASFAGTSSCDPSTDLATVTLAPPGASATGGGWYSLAGSGRINFGFTVARVDPSCTAACAYKGQVLLINNGKWRLKGGLADYLETGASGAASGSGALSWWDPTLNGGLGAWVPSESGVGFAISFSDAGRGGKKSGDTFGIHVDHVVIAPPEPSSLPNSLPQPLKGGNVLVRAPR